MTGQRVRIGLAGCGAISELGHAPALRSIEADCEVVAVADVVPARRDLLGGVLDVPAPHRYPDVATLLRDGPGCDLLVVALPPEHTVRVVTEALAAGLRVLSEKPMAPSSSVARELARAAGDRLGVVHNYRYRSDVRQALAHLGSGLVGTPRFLRLERPDPGHFAGAGADPGWRRTGSVAGCLVDNAYHWIYLAEDLAGSPVTAVGAALAAADGAADDLALLTLTHASGALTSVQAAWCADDALPVLEVHGPDGSLRLTGDGGECLASAAAPGVGTDREPAYLAMYRDVVSAVREGRPFGASPARCAEVLEVIEAAVTAARQRRTVPLPGRAPARSRTQSRKGSAQVSDVVREPVPVSTAGPGEDQLTVAACSVGRPALLRTLEDLRSGDTGQIWEVLVVDNTPDAGLDSRRLREVLDPVPLRVLRGDGAASTGRNLAIGEAATDVVLFIDDDCRPASTWAKAMSAFMAAEPTVAAAFGAVEPVPAPGGHLEWTEIPELGTVAWGTAYEEGRQLWCPAVSAPPWQGGIVRGEPTVPWCVVGSSNNLALRRSRLLPGRPAFLPHLGPGTGAGSGEDTELGYALMAAGEDVAYVPESRVFHDSWLEMHEAERAHRCYFRGNVEALGHHALGGDGRAVELLMSYIGHFLEDNDFGLRDLGSVLEWAYGDLGAGMPRPPLRKSDLK